MPVTSWHIPVKMSPLILFTFLLYFSNVHARETVQMIRNPGCKTLCTELKDKLDVLYLRSWDHNSSVHFLVWATGNATPSVLALHSSNPTAKVSIDWNSTVSKWPKMEKVIGLENVTQSYALAFLSLIDLRLTTTDGHQRTTPTLDRSPGSFHPHYFDKCKWQLTNQSTGNRNEFWASYSTKLVSSSQEGVVQLKLRLRKDKGSLDLEVSLNNLESQYPNGQLGLEVVLLSNMSVVNNDDYLLTQRPVNAGRLYTVYLDQRIDSISSLTDTGSLLKGFFQSNSKCHREPTKSCEATLDVWRQKLTKAQRKHHSKSLASLFYGERLNQQYAGLDSMKDVVERWGHAENLPPVGLRTQRIYFQPSYNGSDNVVWYGSFGFTTEPQQGIPLTVRRNSSTLPSRNRTISARPIFTEHTSIDYQAEALNVEHESRPSTLPQSATPGLHWPLIILICLAVVCLVVFVVLLVVRVMKRRRRLAKESLGLFVPLSTASETTVEVQL